MRTKVLLCAVALAAGLATSMAQVYSLNVVGYYNVTVAGNGAFTLCANQLNTGTNGINQVLPTATDGSLVYKFVNGDYNVDLFLGGAWFDANTTAPSATKLNPGEGFFFNNAGATAALTFVGEVPQGNGLTVALPPNFALVGTYTPQALELVAANSFPSVDGMLHYAFVNGDYQISLQLGGAWFDANTTAPVTIQPAVGQGYFINNPDTASHNWVRNFTVQ